MGRGLLLICFQLESRHKSPDANYMAENYYKMQFPDRLGGNNEGAQAFFCSASWIKTNLHSAWPDPGDLKQELSL